MSQPVWAIIGSGTVEQTRGILPPSQRGILTQGQGIRMGTQVMVGNPEDLVAVDAWAASGISVGTSNVVEIIGPHTNPLPRCREISVGNFTTSTTVFIGPWNSVGKLLAEGIPLPVGSSANSQPFGIRLPLLHNNSIYAIATGATASVRILVL